MDVSQLKAKTVNLAGKEVSQIAFGTEHINQYLPEYAGKILCEAAVQNNVFFWDTDNCYGSQPAVAAAFMMCYTVAGVVGSLVLGMISSKYGQKIGSKAKQLAIPSMIYGIIAVVGILAGSKRTVVLLVMIALGFCCSAFHLHGWNLGLDAAKIDEYKTGEDKGCSYVAFIGFAFKVGGAVGMWLIGFILQCFGFNSELASQSSNALVGIQICFYVIAGIFMIIGAIVLFRNPLTREKLDAIMDGIERKRQGLPVDESKFSDLL